MKNRLSILTALILTFVCLSAAKPDFAFPKKVEQTSTKEMEKSLKDRKYPEAMRSMMNLILAKSEIDRNSLSQSLNLIEKKGIESGDSVFRGMTLLLQAQVIKDIYISRRYFYNQRQLPLTPYPDNIFEYSGDQFKARIVSLLDSLQEYYPVFSRTALDKWTDVIDIPSEDMHLYPTLLQFSAQKSTDIISAIGEPSPVYPLKIYENRLIDSRIIENIPEYDLIVFKNYSALLNAAGNNALLYIAAEISRINWAYSKTPDEDSRRKAILNLYDKFSNDPACALALVQLTGKSVECWDFTDNYLKRFPESIYKKEINSFRNRLKIPFASVKFKSVSSPKLSVSLKVSVNNLPEVNVDIFKIENNIPEIHRSDLTNRIQRHTLRFDDSKPFHKDTTIEVTLPKFGIYTAAICDAPGQKAPYNPNYPKLVVTNIFLSSFYPIIGDAFATARNLETGAPLSGVSLNSYRNNTPKLSTITGESGTGNIAKGGNRVYPVRGEDRFSTPLYYYKSWMSSSAGYNCSFQTSLPIYHPGDSMKFVGVTYYNSTKNAGATASGATIKYVIRDVNYQIVDSATVVSDSFGRIVGGCKLPTEGLTGYYNIEAIYNKENIGSASFMVSDYKLPTFAVSLKQMPDSTGNDIIFQGSAISFSGFPVSEATVNVSVTAESPARFFYMESSGKEVYTTSATTDELGFFNIKIPRGILSSEEYKKMSFRAVANVTSAAGETRSASDFFSLGKSYFFSTAQLENYNLTSGKPLFKTYLINGTEANIPAVIEISKNDSTLLTLSPDNLKPLEKLSTSRYVVRISAADTTLADTYVSDSCIMYNPKLKTFDLDKLLWTPEWKVSSVNGKFNLLLGTSEDSVYVEKILSDGEKMIAREWINLSPGLQYIPVEIPDSLTVAFMQLSAVKNNKYEESIFRLENSGKIKKLEITFSSFRDKTISGSSEKWEIKTAYKGDKGVKSAIILDVFSKAIEEIMPHRALQIYRDKPLNRVSTSFSRNDDTGYYAGFNYDYRFHNPLNINPVFQTFGISWTGESNGIRSRRVKMYSAAKAETTNAIMDDMAETEEVVAVAEFKDSGTFNEVVSLAEGAGDEGFQEDPTSGTSSEPKPDNNINYRQSEVPLALFAPDLTTDDNGNLVFSFTLPDATTTWSIITSAYTEELYSGSDTRTLTASKPVMVQTSAPRFLRAGDTAILKSTIMNAADKDLDKVAVTTEVLNITGTEILASRTEEFSVRKGDKKVIDLTFNAPADMPGVILRTKAVALNYSDAEQASFPILPASERVVEATPFYISPDSTSITLNIDSDPSMISSLEYCENAVWTVVQALPGLSARDNMTAPDAASAIFSGAVAGGIIRNNPAIAAHLKRLAESHKTDSTAIAALLKNEDVKLAVLAASLWMRDAMSDSERISRLSLLFSNKEIDRNFKTNLNTLAKLVRKNGWGWSASSDEASQWATETVLTTFAILKQTGFLPSDKKLDSMIENALSWLDNEIAKDNSRNSKPAVSPTYTFIRSVFKSDNIPSGARKTISATVKYMVENAINMPLKDKALAAMILNMNGYPSSSVKLLESIEEFSTTSPEGDVSWKNIEATSCSQTADITATAQILNAFATIQPSNRIIDGIRLWLINEKSRRDWGSSQSATYAIAAILDSGSDWTAPKTPRSAIRINGGEPLEFTPTDIATGYFRSGLPSGRLSILIDRVGRHPAYGAVYSTGRRQLADIKPVSLPDLSISKEMYILKNGKWKRADKKIAAGSRVKVVLTIKSEVNLSYVMITDNRAACLEPVSQLPGFTYTQGLGFYKEPRNAATNLFIDFLPRGIYMLEEEFNVDRNGTYSSGTASLQSQYAPAYSVRSGANLLVTE